MVIFSNLSEVSVLLFYLTSYLMLKHINVHIMLCQMHMSKKLMDSLYSLKCEMMARVSCKQLSRVTSRGVYNYIL